MKKQITLVLSFLFCCMLQAQEYQHFLHLTVGGGLHNLSYNLQNGTQSGQSGNTINLGYSCFFTQHWGVQSGLGLQWFNARSTINYKTASSQNDIDGEKFELRTNYSNLQEKQQALFLDIPLTLQYRLALSRKMTFQGSAGGKLSIPVSSSYKTTGGSITTTGYYAQYGDLEVSDSPENGLITTTDTYKGKLSLCPLYMAVADVGGLYSLSSKLDLYLGAYVNYGLNNALKADAKDVYQLDGVYNGVLASKQTATLTPISLGVKLGVYFRLSEPPKVIIADDKLPLMSKVPEAVQKTDTLIAIQKKAVDKYVVKEQPVTNRPAIEEKEKVADRPLDTISTITIYFAKNSDKILDEETAKLKELGDMLKADQSHSLQITGYSCDWGTSRNNLRMGLKRANMVKAKLLLQGVPANRLTTITQGEESPLVPNTSEDNRKKNRRVEIKVLTSNR